MANNVLSNSKIWVNQYDISGRSNAISMETGAEPVDDTEQNDTFVRRKPGIKSTTFQIEGFADHVFDTDAATFTPIGIADTLLSIAPLTGAAGEVGYFGKVNAAQYSTGGAIGNMHPFSMGGKLNGNIYRGTIEFNGTAAADGSSSGNRDGAVTIAKPLYAVLHVIDSSGSSPTLDIELQSDDNSGFTSATTRGSFAQAIGPTSEFLTITGTITDNWWRINYTIGGTSTPTFEFVVIIALEEIYDQRLGSSTFWADYNTSINADAGGGDLTGTGIGSPTVLGGDLILNSGSVKAVDYAGLVNADNALIGTIRFGYIPKYTNAPSEHQSMISIGSTSAKNKNLIHIGQSKSTQQISIHIYSNAGTETFIANDIGVYNFTADTEVEIELNWDITNEGSETRLFIDRVQHGSTFARGPSSAVRDSDIDLIRVGSGFSGFAGQVGKDFISKHNISYLEIFNDIRHTSNYTPE